MLHLILNKLNIIMILIYQELVNILFWTQMKCRYRLSNKVNSPAHTNEKINHNKIQFFFLN